MTADDSRRWAALGAVSLGTFMATLDSSVVNLALPALAIDLDAGLAHVEWVVFSFLLVLVALLLNVGRIGDLFGRRRVYVAGLLVFGTASLACAAATGVGFLVGARAVQAVGAAMMASLGPAMLVAVFPPERRGQVLGLVGLAVSAGLASGPAVGGLLIGALSWRWIFLPNVPLSFLAAMVALRCLPRRSGEQREPLDLIGSALLAVGLTALLLALSFGPRWGFADPRTLGFFAAAFGAAVAFVAHERRSAAPVLELSLFARRQISAPAAAGLLVFLAVGSIQLVLPFHLVGALGLDLIHAGAILTAFPAAMAVVAPLSGWAADRLGSNRGIAVAGAVLVAAGALGLGFGAARAGPAWVALAMAALGLGVGVFQSPNNSALLGAVPRERLGTASGLLATMRSLGMLVGNAVGGAAFLAGAGGTWAEAPAVAGGLGRAALVAACAAGAAAAISLLNSPPRPRAAWARPGD
jgi:EmrB/QacA subfamily drug resistance transporter